MAQTAIQKAYQSLYETMLTAQIEKDVKKVQAVRAELVDAGNIQLNVRSFFDNEVATQFDEVATIRAKKGEAKQVEDKFAVLFGK